MKELSVRQYLHNDGSGLTWGYDKSEVDEYIAELKDRISEERSAKVDYKISANDLSYGLHNAYVENRRLRRALWLARASMCKLEKERCASHIDLGNRRNRKDPAYVKTGKLLTLSEWRELWENNERKCRAKAEEYK